MEREKGERGRGNDGGRVSTFDISAELGNRKWAKHEDGYGDVFGYDLNDQATAVLLDVQNPDTTPVGDQTIFYDGSGNRTTFRPYDWEELYTVNDLNQYTTRTESDNPLRPTPTPRPSPSPAPRPTPPGQLPPVYDYDGNMANGFDGSTYSYDAQNRLLSATKGGVTMSFAYDGLNRQVSRTVTGGLNIGGGTTFNVWDGWDLIEEYQSGNNVTGQYLYGPGGLIKNLTANNYYYQDASGSTSHLADTTGHLVEWYRYDLQGTPIFYDSNNSQLSTSNYAVRHLFTGQQWYSDIGLYDLRNRFYSPDIGRFLQPDPTGFSGDPSNLYRYCKNNPVTRRDPSGLQEVLPIEWAERVTVFGWFDNEAFGPGYDHAPLGMGLSDPSLGRWGGSPFGGFGPRIYGLGFGSTWRGIPFRLPEGDLPSSVPSQNPEPILSLVPTALSGIFPPLQPFTTFGTLKIDADGALTTNFSNDPDFAGDTSALRDVDGNYVPPSKGLFGVDSNTDSYGVAPRFMFPLGTTVVYTNLNNGMSVQTQVGDYGTNSNWFGEVSITTAQGLGANVIFTSHGPVPAGPNIPLMITVYPGSAGQH